MVAPGRPDLYLPMFSFSRKELLSLPVVSAEIYPDLQVPCSWTVTVVGKMQCSDWLSQTSSPSLKARQGPPPEPYKVERWKIPQGKSGCYYQRRRKNTKQAPRTCLLHPSSSLISMRGPEVQQEEGAWIVMQTDMDCHAEQTLEARASDSYSVPSTFVFYVLILLLACTINAIAMLSV